MRFKSRRLQDKETIWSSRLRLSFMLFASRKFGKYFSHSPSRMSKVFSWKLIYALFTAISKRNKRKINQSKCPLKFDFKWLLPVNYPFWRDFSCSMDFNTEKWNRRADVWFHLSYHSEIFQVSLLNFHEIIVKSGHGFIIRDWFLWLYWKYERKLSYWWIRLPKWRKEEHS